MLLRVDSYLPQSHIDGAHELLDLVEQVVALLDHVLVLRVLHVGPAGLDNVTHLAATHDGKAKLGTSRQQITPVPSNQRRNAGCYHNGEQIRHANWSHTFN
jgi:hypothetical protein